MDAFTSAIHVAALGVLLWQGSIALRVRSPWRLALFVAAAALVAGDLIRRLL